MDLEVARQILIDHSKNPRNRVLREVPTPSVLLGECRNPLCGDHVKVYIEMQDERIQSIQLQVKACTICTASASLMSEAVKTLTFEKVKLMRDLFEKTLLSKANEDWPREIESFLPFDHLRQSPARIPCALIPWFALMQALLNR